ncbi:hypothetical protein RRG08_014495 [Elysia crispata]|uniref:Uncharacterized protein n=1 Tax=Elysia crispata TaxID=231223 RepID=A0AAE1AW16_9GAST|nr:hypothetical protein RRG08_014495 [Elysia crispata]
MQYDASSTTLSCFKSLESFFRRSVWPGFNFEMSLHNEPKLRWVTGSLSAWGPLLPLVYCWLHSITHQAKDSIVHC